MTRNRIENDKLNLEKEKLEEEKFKNRKAIEQREREQNIGLIGNMFKSSGSNLIRDVFHPKKVVTHHNAPEFYKKFPEVIAPLLNVPQFFQNGVKIPGARIAGNDAIEGSLPQALILWLKDVFGYQRNPDGSAVTLAASPLNLYARECMTKLRQYNSRIGEYEPSDVMQYLFAGVDIFKFLIHVRRAILITKYFSAYNPNVGISLLRQLGFDADDIWTNIKGWEAWLINAESEANEFLIIPDDMSYLARKLVLYANIYKEGAGSNAQYVLAACNEFFYYDESLSKLYGVKWISSNTGINLSSVNQRFRAMMNRLNGSTFITTLIADMRSGGIVPFKLPAYTSDDKLDVKPIDQTLLQFMNANLPVISAQAGRAIQSLVRTFQVFSNNNIGYYSFTNAKVLTYDNSGSSVSMDLDPTISLEQDSSGYLYMFQPYERGNAADLDQAFKIELGAPLAEGSSDIPMQNFKRALDAQPHLFNYYKSETVPADDVLESTRLHPCYHVAYVPVTVGGDTYNAYYLEYTTYGTEIPLCLQIVYGDDQYTYICGKAYDYTCTPIMSFNYKPTQIVIQGSGNNGIVPIQQWDKVVEISKENLFWIDRVSVRSLFHINFTRTKH